MFLIFESIEKILCNVQSLKYLFSELTNILSLFKRDFLQQRTQQSYGVQVALHLWRQIPRLSRTRNQARVTTNASEFTIRDNLNTRAGFLSEYPIPWKNPDPEGKKSRIPGILHKSREFRENPEIQKIPNPGIKIRNPEIKIPRRKEIPNPGDKNRETKEISNTGEKILRLKKTRGFSGFCTRDFSGIFQRL